MTRITRHAGRVTCLSLLLVALMACANGAADPSAGSSPGDIVSAGPGETWLAALSVEEDPDALDADTRALKDVLGGALIVSPASCFRGLPAEVDGTAYVLGVQASTQEELRALVVQTERDPAFEVRVQMLCTD
jgi:hypothetical protein